MPLHTPFNSSPFSVIPLLELAIIQEKDDLGMRICEACQQMDFSLQDHDILVVAQAIVSRAEGRVIDLTNVTPSPRAIQLATQLGKRPELVEVILQVSKQVVRAEQGHLIVETPHGFVCANAGVDTSNVPGKDVVTLLPEDPDASARRIRRSIKEACDVDVAVIISDTHGRPFRKGAINVAIGVSGIEPIRSYVGMKDLFGYELRTTTVAVADELASAAELVMGEADEGIAVVVIRGYRFQKGESSAQTLVRDPEHDIFRR